MGLTKIEYADEVSNPLFVVDKQTGKPGTHCEKPDRYGTCWNCWAEEQNIRGKPDNGRFGTGLFYDRLNRDRVEWHRRDGEMERLVRLNQRRPRSKKFPGNPLIVFTNDTYDLFQPSISDDLRDWVFNNYDSFENLSLLIQTTYPATMSRYLRRRYPGGMPPQFVVGLSVGTQRFFERNLGHLVSVPARRRYVIFEPLLGKIDLFKDESGQPYRWSDSFGADIDLIIVGGESGTDARPCDARWIRRLVKDAHSVGTSVLVKQMGVHCRDGINKVDSWPAGTEIVGNISITSSVPELSVRIRLSRKGNDPLAWPADLRIREFPRLPRRVVDPTGTIQR